jgi:hypothetical protein
MLDPAPFPRILHAFENELNKMRIVRKFDSIFSSHINS